MKTGQRYKTRSFKGSDFFTPEIFIYLLFFLKSPSHDFPGIYYSILQSKRLWCLFIQLHSAADIMRLCASLEVCAESSELDLTDPTRVERKKKKNGKI